MSYYDPLYPSIQATRAQIQRSILALEDKLRLRREIDLELQLSRNQEVLRRTQVLAYEDQLRHRDRFYSDAYERELAERARFAQEEEVTNLRHLSKIEEYERERVQLELERQRMGGSLHLSGRSPYRLQGLAGVEDEELLIRKYQDGTRAREYKKSLDSYSNSQSKYNSNTKSRRDGEGERSPYSNLKYDSERNVLNNEFVKTRLGGPAGDYRYENEGVYSNQGLEDHALRGQPGDNNQGSETKLRSILKNKGESASKPNQSEGANARNQQSFGRTKDENTPSKVKLSSRGRSRSQKQLNSSKRKKDTSAYSPYRSYLDPKTDRSPAKSQKSAIKKSVIQRSRNSGDPESNALQKIKNRLKVSEIVYRDSKFKNVKHELAHLFNTYDCESKLRKEIKDKINSHPQTLRKHAMVVQ